PTSRKRGSRPLWKCNDFMPTLFDATRKMKNAPLGALPPGRACAAASTPPRQTELPSIESANSELTPILSNECLVAAYLDAIDTLTYARTGRATCRRSAQLKAIAPLASE